jgi:hypothetical protein
VNPKTAQRPKADLDSLEQPNTYEAPYCPDSLPDTFFVLNGDIELNSNRQIFI